MDGTHCWTKWILPVKIKSISTIVCHFGGAVLDLSHIIIWCLSDLIKGLQFDSRAASPIDTCTNLSAEFSWKTTKNIAQDLENSLSDSVNSSSISSSNVVNVGKYTWINSPLWKECIWNVRIYFEAWFWSSKFDSDNQFIFTRYLAAKHSASIPDC